MSSEASISASFSSATPQTIAASITEQANIINTNQNPASYLGGASLYIPNKDFFILIQE